MWDQLAKNIPCCDRGKRLVVKRAVRNRIHGHALAWEVHLSWNSCFRARRGSRWNPDPGKGWSLLRGPSL